MAPRHPIHGDGAEVYKVQTSYAFKKLLDKMKSLGVAMRLELEDEEVKSTMIPKRITQTIWFDGPDEIRKINRCEVKTADTYKDDGHAYKRV